jgi:hypothetical protein
MLVVQREYEILFNNRIQYENESFVVKKSYYEEGLHQSKAWNNHLAIMNQIKLSTYINELIQTGFQIERVVEDVVISEHTETGNPARWYSPLHLLSNVPNLKITIDGP